MGKALTADRHCWLRCLSGGPCRFGYVDESLSINDSRLRNARRDFAPANVEDAATASRVVLSRLRDGASCFSPMFTLRGDAYFQTTTSQTHRQAASAYR